MKRRIWRLLALFVVFAMVAASCGGSDDDSDSSASSSSEEETGGVLSQEDIDEALEADEEEEEAEVTFDRSTIDGIWEEAAYNRQQMIAKITAKMDAGEWGCRGRQHPSRARRF